MSEKKAWCVTDRNCDGYSYVIYACSRGQAIQTALWRTDGAFDDYTFTEIRATRIPALDNYYHGKDVLEWEDYDDRLLMVREAGLYCGYEMMDDECDCKNCPATEHCSRYEKIKERCAGNGY